LAFSSGLVIAVCESTSNAMHPSIIKIALMTFSVIVHQNITFAQSKSLAINLLIDYRPATVEIFSDSLHHYSMEVRNNTKLRLIADTTSQYIIATSGQGVDRLVRDSIYVTAGQTVILNISLAGRCLYDLPREAIPKCPRNHTDQIVPIAYGLIGFINEEEQSRADSTLHLGGCIVTGCDPKHYCKIHKVEF